MSFANPLALWGLLFIPALLIIHLLQRKSVKKSISTSFLLTNLNPPEKEGRSFEKLRNSGSLWLQLLTILLAIWILSQPQFIQKNSELKVAIVIDNSLSMNAFKSDLQKAVKDRLENLKETVSRSVYYCLPSDPTKKKIYSGKSMDELLAQLEQWQATSPNHNIKPVLQQARQLASRKGKVIYFTDHLPSKKPDHEIISIGKKTENLGFVGCEFFQRDRKLFWRTFIRNYSDKAQEVKWGAVANDNKLFEKIITLKARELREIAGPFPEKPIERLQLFMQSDELLVDNILPMVRPKAKELNMFLAVREDVGEFLNRMLKSFTQLKISTLKDADLKFVELSSSSNVTFHKNTIFFLSDPDAEELLVGNKVNIKNPMMDDLNFQGLRLYCDEPFKISEDDKVLLWQGKTPLLFLRENGKHNALFINFSLKHSNASRVPSFVILLYRFIDLTSQGKVAKESINVELSQKISIKTKAESKEFHLVQNKQQQRLKTYLKDQVNLNSPFTPQYFNFLADGNVLLNGASHFADANEADLLNANSGIYRTQEDKDIVFRNSTPDPYVSLWILLMLLCVCTDWFLRRRHG